MSSTRVLCCVHPLHESIQNPTPSWLFLLSTRELASKAKNRLPKVKLHIL
ncbi:hypothetical protein HanRHA438_Chr07g0293111 [Helianthus annuus]|nr:hypothetical protein HanRHA438_Chr07g0293111 [Helianthus annuus]